MPQENEKKDTEMSRLIPQHPYKKAAPLASGREEALKEAVQSAEDEDGMVLIIAFLAMLVFQLGNRIFGRLLTYPMHNYAMFMNIVSAGIYIPLCFAYIIPTQILTNKIDKEQTDIPKYKFAIMGAYDSVAGIMSTFATNYITNASTMVLVTQSAIPISMIISKIALNSTYTMAQYVGAGIVLFGIVVVLIPGFFSTPDPGATVSAADDMQVLWIGLLVASCVPMCMSSVYKEKALGETEINIMYLNGWVAVFQFLMAIPLCLPSASVIGMEPQEIWPNIVGGAYCSIGINTITEDNNPLNKPLDDCSMGPMFVFLYLFFNAVYNFLVILILQIGSSNILYMAGTVIVPLSNVAFSLDFMPGHQPLKPIDIYGLVIIMGGLVVYRFTPQLRAAWDKYQGLEDEDDLETDVLAKSISKNSRKKQARYYGLNQLDALETLIDTRIRRESKRLVPRSPGQIRGNLLYRLGIPPSPHVSFRGSSPHATSYQNGGGASNLPMQSGNLSPRITVQGTPTLTRSSANRGPAAYVDSKGRPQMVGNKVPGHGPSKKYSNEV